MASTTQSNSQVSSWISEQWNWIRELPKATAAHQLILVTTAIVAIVFDQRTKWWVEDNIALHTRIIPVESIGHIFDFLHVKNPGAAFGMGPESGWIFTSIAFLVCGFILFYNSVILGRYPAFRIALGLIMGGALGNVIDRFRIGEVTDFIHFDLRPLASPWLVERVPLLNFAIFNLADTFIFGGVCIMFWLMWKDTLPDDPWTEEEKEPSEAFNEWEKSRGSTLVVAAAPSMTPTADQPLREQDELQLRYGPSSSSSLNWRSTKDEDEQTKTDGRFGLKIALALAVIGLIVTFFVIRKRRNQN